jgi:type II secretory pathway component PulK
VLLSVLWVLVGVSTLALAANLAAREAVAAARNRGDLAAAAWRAEGCLERARAAVTDALVEARREPSGTGAWGRMDGVVARSPLLAEAGCAVEMIAAGAALNVNAADEATLRRLFAALGRTEAGADSLAHALLDWRDEDGVPRAWGAEAEWYRVHGLPLPRNGPFADVREVLRVRGFDRLPGIDTLLSAEPGRVPLSHAPPAVMAVLPGLGAEAAARLAELRMRGETVTDLAAFTGSLSRGAQEEAMRNFPSLVGAVVVEPEAWIVRARGGVGTPPVVSVVEARLMPAGERAAIVRRRTWIE